MKKNEMFSILPEEAVKGCLRDLGYNLYTNGSWKHALTAWIATSFPDWAVLSIVTSSALKRYKKYFQKHDIKEEKIDLSDDKKENLLTSNNN